MLLPRLSPCAGAERGSVQCNAKGQGRRNPQHGGSKQQHGGKGSSSSSAGASAAVPKMSAAAKAAAKRASMFAQQRFERAVATATLEAPSSSSSSSSSWRDRLGNKAAAAADADNGDIAPGSSSSSSSSRARQLQPYLQVVVQHLQQTGASSSSSSSSSSGSRGRGAKRGAARSLLEAHSAVFQTALDLELQEEWREAEERLQSWPLSRLASEGVALFGLAASPDGGLARDVLIKCYLPNRPLPFHSFSQGDILLVSAGDPLADSHEAVVVDYSSRWIRLALNPTAAAAVAAAGRGATWRLDLFANTVSHERCSEALKRFAAGAAGAAAEQRLGAGGLTGQAGGLTGQAEVQQQEVLWRVLAGVIPQGQSLSSTAAAPPPWVRSPQGRQRLAVARSKVKDLVKAGQLNASQVKAIEAGLTRTCTLWQGPPGTGKTTTLLRLCEVAVQLLAPVGGQVLAVAASNVAVDNLVAGMLELGIKVVRLGQPVKVAPALRSVSLEVLAAATPAGQAAAKLRQQLVAAAAAAGSSRGKGSSSRGKSGGGSSSSSRSKPGSSGSSSSGQGMWEQMLALEAAAAAEVLGSVQVVAATCVGAGDPVVAGRGFELVLLDEATQAPEPAALVAAAARAQALVMVGDPKQLPPTVKCREAERLGLGVSLYDRLAGMGLPPLLLDVQYRMHPAICEFPCTQFYGGLLLSWPKPCDRPLPAGVAWPNPQVPVMFIQCNGPESRTAASISISRQREADPASSSSDNEDNNSSSSSSSSSSSGGGSSSGSSSSGYSFFNSSEAAAVVGCLELLLQGGLPAAEVCVITPYSGQVRAIQQLLPRDSSSSNDRSRGNRGSSSSSNSRGQMGPATPSPSAPPREIAGRNGSSSSSSSGSSSSSSSSKLSPSLLTDLEVKSVDGFQGREKEVVLFSAVRSNSSGRVGFLADARRLNVALTRAKRGLVVVGDARTLRADRVWARWLDWAAQQGVILGAEV